MFHRVADANLVGAVAQTRLKGSFIYLANAVNDLRGNWTVLAAVLAPLVVIAALCLLPDAINLEHDVTRGLAPAGSQTVGLRYTGASAEAAPAPSPPPRFAPPSESRPYAPWVTRTLHVLFVVVAVIANLLILVALLRMHGGMRESGLLAEGFAIYRESTRILLPFLWVVILQLIAIIVGFVLYWVTGYVVLIIPGLLAIVFLYFAQYALVFDHRHSWAALLHSRELMRKRFFKVAMRIVVFLAVWSGYNAWVGAAFVLVTRMISPLVMSTGSIAAIVFVLDLIAVGVAYATTAFFFAAGARLYQDLMALAGPGTALERASASAQTAGSIAT